VISIGFRIVRAGDNTLSDMDQTTTVMLVRHGQVANPNHVVYADLPGFDLDADGVLQAHAVGRHLSRTTVDAVVSSPLSRAVQTATSIARTHGLPVTIDGGLSEWNLSSGWVGQIWDDLPVAVPGQLEAYLNDPSNLPYASETLSDLASRVTDSIKRHLESGIRHLVVVAHQDPVAAAVLRLVDEPMAGLLLDPPPHASVTTLILSHDAHWTVANRWVPTIG
jgi:broad specificity phosphatase PhoE